MNKAKVSLKVIVVFIQWTDEKEGKEENKTAAAYHENLWMQRFVN